MARTELKELGEFGLIDFITKDFNLINGSSKVGVGDDAAVLELTDQTVVSTDLLVEGVHFDLSYTPLKHLGYKSVIVNLSDIYAMNAIPQQITVSVALSNRFSVEAITEIYKGIALACQQYNVDLIGGDTTSSLSGLMISVTAIGTAKADKIVYRSGAQVGDLLCVSGYLGSAYLGLQLLEREKQVYMENPDMQPDLEDKDQIVGSLLKPEARKDIIEFFAKQQIKPTSMIDISDGLSSEILHICKHSGVGMLVEEKMLPIAQQAQEMAFTFKMDTSICALHGGEDYELLFTLCPADIDKIKHHMDIHIIGEVIPEEDGVKLHTLGGNMKDLIAQGWSHH